MNIFHKYCHKCNNCNFSINTCSFSINTAISAIVTEFMQSCFNATNFCVIIIKLWLGYFTVHITSFIPLTDQVCLCHERTRSKKDKF